MKMVCVHLHGMMFGPGRVREGGESDIYINWRVEGTEGIAKGTIGWPYYPTPTPSTLDLSNS